MLASVTVVVLAIVSDEEGLETLRSVGSQEVVTLVMLHAIALVALAYRYKLTVEEAAKQKVPTRAWFRLFIVGRFLNALIPQAGTAYRGLRLKEDYKIPLTKYLSGFLAFSWLTTLLNLAVALILILVLEPDLQVGEISGALVVSMLLALAALTPPTLLWTVRKLQVEQGFWGWAYRRTEDMVGGAVGIIQSGATIVRFALAGLAGLAAATVLFAIAFEALELDASLSTIVLFYALLQLGTYVSITPGNLGVMELASGALAAQLGIGLTGGLLVAALVRLTGYATLLIAGISLGGLGALGRVRELQSTR